MVTRQDNWEAVKALFEAALEESAENRSAFLKQRCADASVCAEVERLLAEYDKATSFLSGGLPAGLSPGLPPDIPAELSHELPTVSLEDFRPPADHAARTQQLSEAQVLAGRFRIVRYIAGGGMGEVYEAEDQELRERVAVKTIRREILVQPNAMARFKREVHLARKVTHPNVCRIFDLFRHKPEEGSVNEEIVFISMELLRGKTLAARLNGKRMSTGDALPLVGQMASALQAAHDVGIVHRDFKPGNVVLVGTSGERAVVTDFGLALQSLASDEGVSLSTGQGLLGTPAYMAPEQLEGRPATNASDIYALGLVIYEMVTGVRPFAGDNPLSAAFKRLSEDPRPPRHFATDLSPAWESVILRCLARDPADRFENARDVAAALAENSVQSKFPSVVPQFASNTSRPVEATKPKRFPAVRISVALVLLALAAGIYEWRGLHPRVQPLVVVAGFKNDSGDSAYDWLATDLSETLTADLGAATGVETVPADELARIRTEFSIPPVQNLDSSKLVEVRQAAGANYVLLGNYRINAESTQKTLDLDLRLEDSAERTVGAFHRSGNEGDYSKLVTEVAADVLEKLGKAGVPETEASQLQNVYPASPEARKLYFEALDKLRSMDAPAALDLLKTAAQAEPGNVAIHSALADTWSHLKHDPEAAAEAKKAAEIAENTSLPLEYTVLARARADEMNRNWDSAIKNYSLLFPHYQQLNYGLRLANAQVEGAQPKAALETLNQLGGLRPPMNTDPRIEIAKAKAYAAMNDFGGELHSAQLALNEAEKRNARLMRANAELALCWAHRNLGHVDDAIAACNQAETLFSAFGDNVSAAVALNDVATWYMDRGRYEEARKAYEQVIKIHRNAGAQKDLAGANVNMAVVLVKMGKPQEAQDYIDTALQIAGSIHDEEDQVAAHILKGNALSSGGHPVEAEAEFQKVLAIGRAMGNTVVQAAALSNLAQIQSETDSGSALATYEKVLRLRRANGAAAGVATCLFNMGDVQYHRGELEAAETSYREATQISAEQKDQPGVALGTMSFAQINLERRRLPEAEQQARDALDKLKEAPDPDLESTADSILLRVLVAEGKSADAAGYAERIQKIASQDPDTSFENRLSLAEYFGATGHTNEAVEQIRTLSSDAQQRGRNFAALEGDLLLLKLQAGNHPLSAAQQETLTSIRKRAERAGFGLLISRAARHPA